MPDKEGSDDEKKSTKSVVNKKQKQFLNQEELDLTKIAETFGGYIVEAEVTGSTPEEDELKKKRDQASKEIQQKSIENQKKARESRRRTQGAGGRKDLGSGRGSERVTGSEKPKVTGVDTKGTAERPISDSEKIGMGVELGREQQYQRPKADRSKEARDSYNRLMRDQRRLAAQDRAAAKKPKPTPQQRYSQALKSTEEPVTKKGPSVKRGDPISQTVKPVKNIAARKSAEDKVQSLVKPKLTPRQRYAQTLEKAKPTVIKGGPSVKRGDPVPQIVKPVKKKPVPEIGGYKFNTFSPKEMKKRKTFKQAFGRPTGADPKTGKPTYRVSPVGPAGQKRKRTRGGFKALPRSKNLPDYDTVKTAVDMGLNPDEIDKNKFIDKKVRGDRMDKLGTPDPFKVDTSQASKEVAKQFGTKPVKGGLDFGEPTIPKKVKTRDPLTGRDFKRFRKQQQTAVRTKVRSDIEKNIGKVAKRNVSKAKIATPVVKTLGKETGEAAVKAAGKRALKKAGMKAVAKQIPGVGSLIAGGEAAFRAAKGDMTGAALSLGQAIPGVSIPLAGVDVAREVARARGGAKVGQKVATQVARSLPGSGKKVKDATKVVNPTVVGSAADTSKRFRDFLNKNKMMGVAGGAALGKGVEVASRNTFQGLRPKDVRGGRVGRRSAKQ